jgi:hypothetical protein
MLTSSLLTFFAAAAFSPAVAAWGSLGHQLTGAIAQKLISRPAYDVVKQLLPADWHGNMSRSTTWADEVKRKAGYAGWSGPLHYVDIKDNPSKSCTPYDAGRDCADGKCLVGAIANYTARLDCKYSQDDRSEAVKFLTHFLGDITQPLHNCGRLTGGNGAKIGQFDNRHTLNMHTLWDTTMIEKRVKTDFGKSPAKYIDYLLTQANTVFKSSQAKWTSCMDAAATLHRRASKDKRPPVGGDSSAAAVCAKAWASDAEGLNCDVVWPAFDRDADQDFGAEYYEKAMPVVEQQLVKAGVRMARLFEKFVHAC